MHHMSIIVGERNFRLLRSEGEVRPNLIAGCIMPEWPDLSVIVALGLGVSPGEQLKKGQKVGTGDPNDWR